jgi:hypothetical protein
MLLRSKSEALLLVENIFNCSEIFLDISEVLCTAFNVVACEFTDDISLSVFTILFLVVQISDYSGHPHAGVEMVKSSSLPPDCVTLRGLTVGDGHSTDTSSTSERLFGAPSEGNIVNSYVKHNILFVHGTFKEIIIGYL